MKMAGRYGFPLTTFSKNGKLEQVNNALAAVKSGAPAVGVVAIDGVVVATTKRTLSTLHDEHSVNYIEEITDHIGMAFSGFIADHRPLVKKARKVAQKYYLTYKEEIPVNQLVDEVAKVMQEYTQSGGVRPFGVSLLVCGWYDDKGYLIQCDPSGSIYSLKATAIGENSSVRKGILIEKMFEYTNLKVNDAVDIVLETLGHGFESELAKGSIEVSICDEDGFQRYRPPAYI